jgi:hypothetical protein
MRPQTRYDCITADKTTHVDELVRMAAVDAIHTTIKGPF